MFDLKLQTNTKLVAHTKFTNLLSEYCELPAFYVKSYMSKLINRLFKLISEYQKKINEY